MISLWSQTLQAEPCGLGLARERGWLLAWDRLQWIYLLNQAGRIESQIRFSEEIAQCAIAEDGSGVIAAGRDGTLRWLAPDLTTRWERKLKSRLAAVAVAPFGHFFALADTRGAIYVLNGQGEVLSQAQCPRPLHHLAFAPTLGLIMGCADYGLVGALDRDAVWRWREALVMNVGNLAVAGDGSVLLACFSEGLHHFTPEGKPLPRIATPEPCRLVAQSYEGDRLLVAGMGKQVHLLDRTGVVLARHTSDQQAVAIALGPKGEAAYLAGAGIEKMRIGP